ncbi:DUF3060 domain-containing protein [Mycobacterium hubeiense]|uniref:DUF3060 domain-containing protein n=1 Tax=Mycobacterium hubeiense TaxID=1867256 RepID=UPI000C7F23B2|nr:DUF3060 domain-containing protein [Mycobacterium sp. QGD 101]
MNPQDDPEARIRELERPLADVARTSELGTTPYAPYTPPKKGFRPWLWALVCLAVVVPVIAAIGYFTTSTPDVVSGGAIEETTTFVEAPPITDSASGVLSVSGIGENRTVDCNNSLITISGAENTVTITGRCGKLSVSGVYNRVTVDDVEYIIVSGFENQIVYHSGSPEIHNIGNDNSVEQG